MTRRDTSIIHTKVIGRKERLVVISLILFIFAFLLLPIYQAATMRELSLTLAGVKREVVVLDEKEQLLRAYLAKSSTVDVASQAALEQDIPLQKIPFNKAKLVIIKENQE